MNNFTSYRARFRGELAGIKVNELNNLDYDITTKDERLDFINKKLEQVNPFYEEYFDIKIVEDEEGKKEIAYFNYSPNVTDELSFDINICKTLEGYANYILNSKDLPREKQQKYNILSEEDFKKILRMEVPMSSFNENDEVEDDECMDILDTRKENDYTNLNHKISKSDFEDEEVKDVLLSYQKYKDYLKNQMELIKNKQEADIELFRAKRILGSINDDMIQSKIKLKQIRCHAKRLGDESPTNDMSEIDYTNLEHVKILIKNCRFGEIEPDNEMSYMAYDMETAIKLLHREGVISDKDYEIIFMINDGMSNVEIAKYIQRDEKVVRRCLDRVSKLVSEHFEICEIIKKLKKIK